jgi:hypothetical protein
LNTTELKTWTDKDPKHDLRVKISVPKGKKLREVYFYTNDLFEAELVKLEIEKKILGSVKEPVFIANEIWRYNIASNIGRQMFLAPTRKSNWEKIAAVVENYPDNFAQMMADFGQKLLDKAKSLIAPKNKWLFPFKNLVQDVNEGKKVNNSIKSGKLLVHEEGLPVHP